MNMTMAEFKRLGQQPEPAKPRVKYGTGEHCKRKADARKRIMVQRDFLDRLAICNLPVAEPERAFHPDRKWRFDYAWPSYKVALEVDGGIWVAGRHTRGAGQRKDMEKFNAAAVLGWRILKCEPKDLLGAETMRMIRAALKGESL